MIDITAFGRSTSSPYDDEDEVERRFVFVAKWQHFFGGRPTWSETRWVFDRADWSVVFLEIMDQATMEWVCATREEVSSVDRDLNESDSRFLDDLDEWGLSQSDEPPAWACSRAKFRARSDLATRERAVEDRRRNAVRLRLPEDRSVRTVVIRFGRCRRGLG